MQEKVQVSTDTPAAGDVTILPPDFSLKKAIGNIDIAKLLDETVVERAQQNVNSLQDDFLKWINDDIATLEAAYEKLVAQTAGGNEHMKLRDIAIAIKSMAGMFGFYLASNIARSLYIFCEDFSHTEAQCLVVRKHIDAINLILKNRMTGHGGAMGDELLQDMAKLVGKFRKN